MIPVYSSDSPRAGAHRKRSERLEGKSCGFVAFPEEDDPELFGFLGGGAVPARSTYRFLRGTFAFNGKDQSESKALKSSDCRYNTSGGPDLSDAGTCAAAMPPHTRQIRRIKTQLALARPGMLGKNFSPERDGSK
jgi:hypothetical protein